MGLLCPAAACISFIVTSRRDSFMQSGVRELPIDAQSSLINNVMSYSGTLSVFSGKLKGGKPR